jgi:hypothetical protein
MPRQKDQAMKRPAGQPTKSHREPKKSMRPVEQRYRNFCEHIAAVCETEAKAYEEDPSLHDGDFQFISSLRAKCDEWRQQLRRVEGAYLDREA